MKGLERLAGLLGVHFVPENNVAAVMRWGMYHRSVGPGLVWRNPLSERITAPIKVSMRFLSFTAKEVLTKDTICADIALGLLYRFDPRPLDRRIAAELVRLSADQLQRIVIDKADYCLRRTVARFEARQLCREGAVVRIQRELTRTLNCKLGIMGVDLARDQGVMIQRISLPEDLKRTILEVKRHELTLEMLKQYGDAKIDRAVVAELANNHTNGDGALPLFLLANQLGRPASAPGNGAS